eukprot:485170-Amorphochlora_amoeboformis.AAC.2
MMTTPHQTLALLGAVFMSIQEIKMTGKTKNSSTSCKYPIERLRGGSKGSEQANHNASALLVDPDWFISDPRALLGVSATATPEEVKKAYRKLAARHHPDKASDANKALAQKIFQRIRTAHDVILDPQTAKQWNKEKNRREKARTQGNEPGRRVDKGKEERFPTRTDVAGRAMPNA